MEQSPGYYLHASVRKPGAIEPAANLSAVGGWSYRRSVRGPYAIGLTRSGLDADDLIPIG